MRAPLVLSGLLAIALTSRVSSAHTVLVNPPPLVTNDDAKTGPCGCTFGGGAIECPADYPITELEAGSQVSVSWNETIDHTGSFRIAFAPVSPEAATVADFDEAAAQVTVPDDMGGGLFTEAFTVPDTPCDLCTIQVRQLMEGAAEPYYFTCAAVRIVSTTGQGGGAPATTSAGTTVTAGGGTTSAAAGGAADEDGAGGEAQWVPAQDEGGCGVAHGGGGTGLGALLLLAILGWANRRVRE